MVVKTRIIDDGSKSKNRIMFSVASTILFLLIMFSVAGCGKRTSPKPRTAPDNSSPAIKLEKARFRAENLVVDWALVYSSDRKTGERDISVFRIYMLPEPVGCYLCRKKTIVRIVLPATGAAKSESHLQEERQPRLTSTGDNYQALIPARFLRKHLLKAGLFLAVDYIDDKGESSRLSQRRFPPYPLKIPVPEVSASVGRKRCRPPVLNASVRGGRKLLLKLEWTARREGVRRVRSANESWSRMIYHYGLNLYKAGGNSKGEIEAPINPKPLGGSIFSLADFNGPLYARHVDRFGNESEKVQVFDGVCR